MTNSFEDINNEILKYNLEISKKEEFAKTDKFLGEEYVVSKMLQEYNRLHAEINDSEKKGRMQHLRTAIDILKTKRMIGQSYLLGRITFNREEIHAVYKITGYNCMGDYYGILIGKNTEVNGSYHIITNYHMASSTPFKQLLSENEFQIYLETALGVLNEHAK